LTRIPSAAARWARRSPSASEPPPGGERSGGPGRAEGGRVGTSGPRAGYPDRPPGGFFPPRCWPPCRCRRAGGPIRAFQKKKSETRGAMQRRPIQVVCALVVFALAHRTSPFARAPTWRPSRVRVASCRHGTEDVVTAMRLKAVVTDRLESLKVVEWSHGT
jgi:hypothetical protein